LYFLPIAAKADFYLKVILPSVTYGLIVWGFCGKTLLDELGKNTLRATKIIHKIDWYTPSKEVLAPTKCRTLKSLYEHKLLLLTHRESFYGLSPTPIAQHFTKNKY
jgi:hypothetical protein